MGDDINNFKMGTFLDICDELNTGELQSVVAGKEGPDSYLDIVASDGTNFRYYHYGSGGLMGVENLDTGEWPYYSEE